VKPNSEKAGFPYAKISQFVGASGKSPFADLDFKKGFFITKLRVVQRISMDAMLTAVYFVLSYFSISIGGGLEISLASFPIVLSALVFGPWDSSFIALLGEFLDQVLKYGITLTTVLWILPPMLRGLTIGFFASMLARKGRRLEDNLLLYLAVSILGAILTSGGNTLVSYLDSLVYDYPLVSVYVVAAMRFLLGLITAVIVALACRPVAKVIRNLESKKAARP
jgi:ECF transporter S component (folate family)